MENKFISTIVLAAAAGVGAAWAWNKYGKKKCNCSKKATSQDSGTIVPLPPVAASSGPVVGGAAMDPYQTPPLIPATSVMSADGWRNGW